MSEINSKFNACMFKADCMKKHEDVNRFKERITQLETELAAAKKDQSRYQWLKSIDAAKWISLHQLFYEQLDAHIDAAIKDQGK